jgi:hypothetical protein
LQPEQRRKDRQAEIRYLVKPLILDCPLCGVPFPVTCTAEDAGVSDDGMGAYLRLIPIFTHTCKSPSNAPYQKVA